MSTNLPYNTNLSTTGSSSITLAHKSITAHKLVLSPPSTTFPPDYDIHKIAQIIERILSEETLERLCEMMAEITHSDPWFDVPQGDKDLIRETVQGMLSYLKDG